MPSQAHVLLAAVALALLAGCQTVATRPAPFVAVPGFGQVAQVPGAALRPVPRSTVRAVFPATRAAASADRVLPALEKAARYLNLLAREGIRTRPGDVVVVISGAATPAVLQHDRYRVRYGDADANPNLPLVRALRQAGAVVSVCGQALHGQGIADADVAPEIRRDLSAMTTLAELQSRGHALIPE